MPDSRDRETVVIKERCPARAALAGNPSDGYGGAVFAVPVRSIGATVTLSIPAVDAGTALSGLDPAPTYRISDASGSELGFNDWSMVREAALSATAENHHGLILGSIALAMPHDRPPPSFSLSMQSTIPRSVGLGGSSAIVIATIRALRRMVDIAPLEPDVLASLALAVEHDHLGIAAGLQDRVVQSRDEPTMMRFDEANTRTLDGVRMGTYRRVSAGPRAPLFVAYRAETAEPSQAVHHTLRDRFDGGDLEVRSAMLELAEQAELAQAAFSSGQDDQLGAAMDASFELRRSILSLHPGHVEMIEAARNVGAHANYTGSGGAVVILADPGVSAFVVADELRSIGCTIIDLPQFADHTA